MSVPRHIIHLHIPAFPIAVARVVEPRLRAWPVALAPAQSERSLLLCVSPEARAEGIFKGMPVSRAKALCPHLRIIPPNPELTERAFHALGSLVARYTPLWEPAGAGHIYLDLTGTERLWGRVRDTAYRINREVKARLELLGAAGVAANKMVSSIASRILPPEEEILDVPCGREAAFMAPLRVTMVPGIGRLHLKLLLEELNIIRVRQLAALDMESLRLIFGSRGPIIHQRAMGIDPTPVYPVPQKPSVCEEITFAEDENDNEKLLAVLHRMVERCAWRLRERKACPQRAGILIRYADHMEVRRQCRLPSLTYWDFELYPHLKRLFFKACTRRTRVRFMRIWFSALCYEDKQLMLFDCPSPWKEKSKAVVQALDKIRVRYGENAIQYAKAI